MARTLLELANDMFELSDKIEEATNDLKREVANVLVSELLAATPVDTSKAISNWRATTGTAVGSWIEAHFPGSQGSTGPASARQALQDARAAIAGAKPGQAISIFNNVPYIRRLNDGYSSQAPAMFVEACIMIARRHAKERGLQLNL